MLVRSIGLVLGLLVLAAPSVAQVRLEGTFAATKECPAHQSISKQTNPGNVTIVAGNTYPLIGKNKDAATHYLIEIAGAEPAQRWVAVNCGNLDSAATDQPDPVPDDESASVQSSPRFVLAIGWQPAFCETRPSKPECESQTDDRF